MKVSIYPEKDSLEMCFEGSTIKIFLIGNEVHIAEEVTYEVATGEVLSKIQIVIKDGKAYLQSPFGLNEISAPENIFKGIRAVLEEIKEKHKVLYDKFNSLIPTSTAS